MKRWKYEREALALELVPGGSPYLWVGIRDSETSRLTYRFLGTVQKKALFSLAKAIMETKP